MNVRHRSRSQGQSVVELAIMLPLLALTAFGTLDITNAFSVATDISAASRAGMREGIKSTGNDIGDAVRNEVNAKIPNTITVWGATGPGQPDGDCTGGGGYCGDPNGCAPSAFTSNQVACFAVRYCTVGSVPNEICQSYSGWASRPPFATSDGLEVLVVYKYRPLTSSLRNFTLGGALYLDEYSTGAELY